MSSENMQELGIAPFSDDREIATRACLPPDAAREHELCGSPSVRESFLCRLGEAWTLYFPVADRLLILNPTAKMAWDLLRQGYGEREIASLFARRFGISEQQAAGDVAQVLADLSRGGQPDDGDADAVLARAASPSPDPAAVDQDRPTRCGVFRFGGSRINVLSSVLEAGDSLFSRFQHRASRDGDGADVLEIAGSDAAYRLTFGGRLIAEPNTIAQLLSRLVELLVSLEHSHVPQLAYCHAAAVSRAGRSVLMPGSSGVGKSTLTAFLVANGFAYVGDDTIAIGEDDLALLPLPTSLSIKSGAWTILEPLYPSLTKLRTVSRYGRRLRYLEPQGNYQTMERAAAPAALVFPAYAAGEPTRWRALRPIETMIHLVGAHARLATPATEARLGKLIRFVEQTPAYELTYSELPAAMNAIEGLLAS